MKKNLLSITALVLLVGPGLPTDVGAQVGWYAGASGGVSSASLSGSEIISGSSKLGPVLGGMLSYRFTGSSAVVLEGNWASYGGQDVRLRRGSTAEGLDVDLSYVEFPLLINAFRPVSDEVTVLVYFGVSAGINLSCDVQSAGGSTASCESSELGANAASTVFSVPVGGGLGYTLRNGSMLAADVRYVWGVSDSYNADLPAVNSRAWQVTAKWYLPLSR